MHPWSCTNTGVEMRSWPIGRFGAVALALIAASAQATGAVQEAVAWLERMSHAVQRLNYEGTFVYRRGDRLDTMRITHMVDGDQQFERLISLNGAQREVIRDSDSVICLWPEQRSMVVQKRKSRYGFPVALPGDVGRLREHYELLSLGPGRRMADKPVQRVAIQPRDRFRYGYQFWLDTHTALPLKSRMIDERGETIEEIMFTSLRLYDRFVREKVRPTMDIVDFHRIEASPPEISPPPMTVARWQFERLPPGFVMKVHTFNQDPDSSTLSEHMLFSDGLASFSIYVEPAGRQNGLQGRSTLGAVNAYGRTVEGYQVTVVGDVPSATVHDVGTSAVPVRQVADR